MWQVVSDVSEGPQLGVIALFTGVASVFVISRLPRDVREARARRRPTRRSRRQRFKRHLVMSVDQGLRVLVAAVHVSACFVVFGKPAITPDVIESWIDGGPHAVAATRRRASSS